MKMIPVQKTTNGVEMSMESPEMIKLRSGIQPDFVLITSGTSDGIDTDFVLSLDRDILSSTTSLGIKNPRPAN